jgi:hypothetical protein
MVFNLMDQAVRYAPPPSPGVVRRGGSEAEWKNPENLSFHLLMHGVSTRYFLADPV